MQSPILLERPEGRFRPGEPIRGTIDTSDWEAERVDVRLFWYTRGKGDSDSEVIQSKSFPLPANDSTIVFEFTAPHRPYSFSSKLITLNWAIEAVLFPEGTAERVDLTISPQAREIALDQDSLDD